MPISDQWSRQTLHYSILSLYASIAGVQALPGSILSYDSSSILDLMRIRIQIRILLFTLIRIPIWLRLPKMMRIRIRNTGLSCNSTHAYLHLF